MEFDLDLLNILWGILVVPLKWLYDIWKKKCDDLAACKTTIAEHEIKISSLESKIDPLSENIKLLTKEIAEAELGMQKSLTSLAISGIQQSKRGTPDE